MLPFPRYNNIHYYLSVPYSCEKCEEEGWRMIEIKNNYSEMYYKYVRQLSPTCGKSSPFFIWKWDLV
jgi:hypothetical protein